MSIVGSSFCLTEGALGAAPLRMIAPKRLADVFLLGAAA